jgi:hypothetical protein
LDVAKTKLEAPAAAAATSRSRRVGIDIDADIDRSPLGIRRDFQRRKRRSDDAVMTGASLMRRSEDALNIAQFREDRPLCLMGMCHFSLDLLETVSRCERRRARVFREIVSNPDLPSSVRPRGFWRETRVVWRYRQGPSWTIFAAQEIGWRDRQQQFSGVRDA